MITKQNDGLQSMKMVKTKVQATTRKLNAKYTVEEAQELEHEIGDELAKILQEEIDKEILAKIKGQQLVMEGWTKIPFTVKCSIDWFKENIQDEYSMLGGAMYFKSQGDAVLYSLTWSDKGLYYD